MSRTYTAGLLLDRSSPEGCVRQTRERRPTKWRTPVKFAEKDFFPFVCWKSASLGVSSSPLSRVR